MRLRIKFKDGEILYIDSEKYELNDDVLTTEFTRYEDIDEVHELVEANNLFVIVDELLHIKDTAIKLGGYTKEAFDREEELLVNYFKFRGRL